MQATATHSGADVTLYDSDAWHGDEAWEYAKRSIAERYVDDDFVAARNLGEDGEPLDIDGVIERECESMDDATVWEEIDWYLTEDLNNAIYDVDRKVREGDRIVYTGTVGLWDGARLGGGLADSFADAIHDMCGRDCEIESIEVVDGDVHVTAVHHDGRCEYTVRALTDAGWDALNDWTGYEGPLAGMSEAEAHRCLMDSDEYTYSIAPEL